MMNVTTEGNKRRSAILTPTVGVGSAALFLIALPFLLQNQLYYLDTVILALLWGAAAGAWNLAGGYGGLLSLGHAAFFGIGAYTSTLLFVRLGISPWLGMLVGAVLAAILGWLIGIITLRMKGPFFGLATIAIAEVLMIVAVNWTEVTQGSQGITVPYKPGFANMAFDSKIPYYFIALVICLIPFLLARWLKQSKFGYELMAIRDNEAAAQALGIHTVRVKVGILVISSAITAVAGTFYAQYVTVIEPYHEFSFNVSIQMVLMTMIGGLGMALGPVFGSFVVTGLDTLMRDLLQGTQGGVHAMMYGTLLVLVVLFVPEGMIPWLKERFRSGKGGRSHGSVVDSGASDQTFRGPDGGG
ncbi:branched-chain amino acid transport system permease protein [Melghirimyces thermohalophilus]|uniref:Branched-chain amino acid transport system permease protein n=2 Tax=Melghirimyces thermohalophilus TaxID=1236220 RepID=A0A1G6IRX5_9BACL|nr:branched-chain amino acid transport system permease protein [Melghirimyces thermohalophilus]